MKHPKKTRSPLLTALYILTIFLALYLTLTGAKYIYIEWYNNYSTQHDICTLQTEIVELQQRVTDFTATGTVKFFSSKPCDK